MHAHERHSTGTLAHIRLREAARRMADGGRIVNFSTSVIGLALPGYAVYAATKSAVETMTNILAKELRGRQITVNAVAPGNNIRSSGTAQYGDALLEMARKATPLKRLGTPEEVARVILFLASDQNDFITGSLFGIDGGMPLWGDIWSIP